MKKLILASSSPRRKEILEKAGYEFEIIVNNIDETEGLTDKMTPAETVLHIAKRKSDAVVSDCPFGAVIISADSIVVLDGEIIGKPKDEEDAFGIISKLSGRTHTVYTGVFIRALGDREISFVSETQVTMSKISEQEIRRYILTKEPMDKAGAYSVQDLGAVFVEKIEGDFFGTMGLPLCRVYRELKELSIDGKFI